MILILLDHVAKDRSNNSINRKMPHTLMREVNYSPVYWDDKVGREEIKSHNSKNDKLD